MKRNLSILIFVWLFNFSLKAQTDTTKQSDQILTAVEINPQFPGGDVAFFKFLSKHLVYPEKALKDRVGGRVIVQFTVEGNGVLNEMKILRSPSDDLSKEALRVLSLSPHWTPGIQNGQPVRMQYAVPIRFDLPPVDTTKRIGAKNTIKDTMAFTAVEKEPSYVGGNAAQERFFNKNLQYPAVDKENGIHGPVYINFIVEKDGSLTNIKVIRAPSQTIANEALRLMAIMPKWNPGMQSGHTVRVYYTISINFDL